MDKENNFDAETNWYELWMQQSKEFFATAEQNLKHLFAENKFVNPEEHLEQINAWLGKLKQQWEFAFLSDEQKIYGTYWKVINDMCKEASDLMVSQWIKRTRDDQPITSVRDLYELWLKCCNDVYQRTLQSKTYQDVYTEFMQAAYKIWKQSVPSE